MRRQFPPLVPGPSLTWVLANDIDHTITLESDGDLYEDLGAGPAHTQFRIYQSSSGEVETADSVSLVDPRHLVVYLPALFSVTDPNVCQVYVGHAPRFRSVATGAAVLASANVTHKTGGVPLIVEPAP